MLLFSKRVPEVSHEDLCTMSTRDVLREMYLYFSTREMSRGIRYVTARMCQKKTIAEKVTNDKQQR